MDIHFLKGDATSPVGDGAKVLVHVCNDNGGWGKGFVLAVSKKWPVAERSYREWHKDNTGLPFALGEVQFVEVEPSFWIANLIGQHGIRLAGGVPPVRYEAIRQGLARVATFALPKKATIHMPRIGCGLAGGNWDEVEPIIQEELADKGLLVLVYDLT